ncbi:DUF3397 domain-containing protein [Paraliobacillus sediminis]|uniref:DUF3397 domain-containing protein n=1 Tax=Paraliobacillus sediminis TaxID=1885916 RepID=UPI000E3DEC38|nr:DUF3397 domain-containing protein [Paraliobacillus sediminis]
MSHLIAYIVAIFITFPIVVTVGLYYILKRIYKHPKKALHRSIAYSTLFYIISVMIMLDHLFQSSYIGSIILFLLVVLMSFVILQWKFTHEIIFKHAFKLFWRSMFLCFFVAYVLLGITGIILGLIRI